MLKIISSRSMSLFFAVAWALLLAACGGGGSGSSTTTTTTTPVAASPTLTLTGSTTAISAATPSTLTATLKSGTGAALPGVVVTFKTTGSTFGTFSPVGGTALTDTNGNATITLAAGVQSGADSVTATATVNGATITSNVFGFTATGITTGSTVALVSLSASLTTVASDNSTSSTITAIAVDGSNAVLPGVTVTFSADTGLLSLASAVTDSTGRATVTFSSGTTNPATRTATITATASGKTSQIPIIIAGANVTLTSSATSLIAGGSPATLTIVDRSGAGVALSGQTITIATTTANTGAVTLGSTTGTTDSTGTFSTTVTPTVAGTVTVTVTSLGLTRSITYTVSGASVAFQISSPTANPATGTIGVALPVTVIAPSPTTSVTFVTTLGTWDGGTSNSVTKVVTGGTVTANLTAPSSGVANVFVYAAAPVGTTPQTPNSSRLISFTAPPTAAYRVTLQSSPSVIAQTRGGTTGISTLLASVFDTNGNPVGGVTVAFSIQNPTGGGESISPVVSTTATIATSSIALGQASATFTAGSLPSSATGVTIRASIIGSTIATNTSPSGSDAAVVIGGTAGSVTIGRASAGTSDSTNTLYILPMSVLVADANGNPVANAAVSLSAWPIAFNTSTTACTVDTTKDYFNEDDVSSNASYVENLSLDAGEDGVRLSYPSGTPVANGTVDGQLTPPNSASGTLPASVTTDSSGTATFNLTYTKANALFITDRITARTFVQGTETKGQIFFRLPALLSDIGPPCLLPASPYAF